MCIDHFLENVSRGTIILGLIMFSLSFGLTTPVSRAQAIVINEIRTNQPGTDNDEYFELAGAPSTSLDGLTYLVIGDDDATNDQGVIEEVTNLTGQTIPASGYFVVAESTFSLGTADLTVSLNFEDESRTHMLVSGFTGSVGEDLDTNDDGTLDATPWASIGDCVAIVEAGGDLVYCATQVGPDGFFIPGQVYRCPSPTWVMGDWELGPYDTPGAANACSTAVTLAALGTSSGGLPAMAIPMGLGLTAVLTGSGYLVWRRRR